MVGCIAIETTLRVIAFTCGEFQINLTRVNRNFTGIFEVYDDMVTNGRLNLADAPIRTSRMAYK